MDVDFSGLVLRHLEEQREMLINALAGGQAKDFVEYKAMTGKLAGLDTAVSIVKEQEERFSSE